MFGNLPWRDDDRVRRAITSNIPAAWPPTETQGRQVYAGSGKNLGYDVTSLVTVTRPSLCGFGKEAFERRRRKHGS